MTSGNRKTVPTSFVDLLLLNIFNASAADKSWELCQMKLAVWLSWSPATTWGGSGKWWWWMSPCCGVQRPPSANLTYCIRSFAACQKLRLRTWRKDCWGCCGTKAIISCCFYTWIPIILPDITREVSNMTTMITEEWSQGAQWGGIRGVPDQGTRNHDQGLFGRKEFHLIKWAKSEPE